MQKNDFQVLLRSVAKIGYEIGANGEALNIHGAIADVLKRLKPNQDQLTDDQYQTLENAFYFFLADQGRGKEFKLVWKLYQFGLEMMPDDQLRHLLNNNSQCIECRSMRKPVDFGFICECNCLNSKTPETDISEALNK